MHESPVLVCVLLAATVILPQAVQAGVEGEGEDACPGNAVADPGFEAGRASGNWTEEFNTSGSPICDSPTCGFDFARSGAFWAWFGGISVTYDAALAQSVTLPSGSADLRFFLLMGEGGSSSPGTFDVKVDGVTLFSVTEADFSTYEEYGEVVLSLDAFADGGAHMLRFEGITNGTPSGTINFIIDDVCIIAGEGGVEGESCGLSAIHTADQDGDNTINLSELLRVIQFFNSTGFGCQPGTEDSYAPNDPDQDCCPHLSDYNPQDWAISLSELLRLIQFFNSGGYTYCPLEDPPTEDGYCPGED